MAKEVNRSYKAPLRDRSSSTYAWAAGGAGAMALLGHAIDRKWGAVWGAALGGALGGFLGSGIDSRAGR